MRVSKPSKPATRTYDCISWLTAPGNGILCTVIEMCLSALVLVGAVKLRKGKEKQRKVATEARTSECALEATVPGL